MTTTVLATCPECHFTASVDVTDMTVTICDTHRQLSRYQFPCERCAKVMERDLTCYAELVLTLHLPKNNVTHWRVPAEALEPHRGAVICLDDVISFGLGWSAVAEELGAA